MSKATVSKRISNQLLKKLSAEYNKKTRKEAERGRPQVLQLKNLNFINETLEQFIDRGKGSKTIKKVTITKQDVKWAQSLAKTYQDRFVQRRGFLKVQDTYEFAHLQEFVPELANDISRGRSFLVSSFSTTATIKRKIIDKILKDKSKALRARVKAKVDRGHGVGGGTAISQLQLAQAASLASKNGIDLSATPGLDDYLTKQFEEYNINLKNLELIKQVLVDYQALVDKKGNLSANYIPVITFQDFYANRGIDAREEKLILEIVRKFFTDAIGADALINLEGSRSLKDKVEASLVLPFAELASKNKNVRLKTSAKMTASDNGRKKAPSKILAAGTGAVAKNRKGPKKSFDKKSSSNTQRSMFSIMAIINKKLPTTLQKNMREPALVNRTGRFANSVRIMEVVETRKGFPSFGYTYDKQPYQVFEVGEGRAPWATEDRDPRRLIDSSIREIAAEMALGRFYTRRL